MKLSAENTLERDRFRLVNTSWTREDASAISKPARCGVAASNPAARAVPEVVKTNASILSSFQRQLHGRLFLVETVLPPFSLHGVVIR